VDLAGRRAEPDADARWRVSVVSLRAFQDRDRLVEFLARKLQFRCLHYRVAQKTSVVERILDAADVI
jgi:hypothetical protein